MTKYQERILRTARRILEKRLNKSQPLENPSAVSEYLAARVGFLEREVFGVMFLDTRHRLIETQELFYGGLDSATVHPRIIVQRALMVNAGAIVLFHNHPSGVAEPSAADGAITRRIIDACSLMDIRVLDHFVVGGTVITSMASLGMM